MEYRLKLRTFADFAVRPIAVLWPSHQKRTVRMTNWKGKSQTKIRSTTELRGARFHRASAGATGWGVSVAIRNRKQRLGFFVSRERHCCDKRRAAPP